MKNSFKTFGLGVKVKCPICGRFVKIGKNGCLHTHRHLTEYTKCCDSAGIQVADLAMKYEFMFHDDNVKTNVGNPTGRYKKVK